MKPKKHRKTVDSNLLESCEDMIEGEDPIWYKTQKQIARGKRNRDADGP